MNFRKHLFILSTIRELRKHGSWTGKTHVQKSLYLLQALSTVEVPFQFVLYMHGPYSFEIEEELAQMRSYAAILIDPIPEYGVSIRPGPMEKFVQLQTSLNPQERAEIERICNFVGNRGVAELEKLATAAWIHKNEHPASADDVARRLHELKPHIPVEDAKVACLSLKSSGLINE